DLFQVFLKVLSERWIIAMAFAKLSCLSAIFTSPYTKNPPHN
ncbi:hypothetical protein NT05LI_3371, partial [Listeria ivanovii FSL F6-596]